MEEIMEKPKLLIVEDDEDVRTQMKWALSQDYAIRLAENRTSAMEIAHRERPHVVTLDLGLPPSPADVQEGFATLSGLLGNDPLTKVIIITGRAEREHALQAVGHGAYDLFYKPIQIEELKVVLRRAFHVAVLEREHQQMQRHYGDVSFEGMLGTSPQMQDVYSMISKVAVTDVPVLIAGESGTGKELAALAIHRRSKRSDGPFVVINCGAVPETLLESELFGHEKGSFTSAHTNRAGRFEAAHGGTLFLDEIGELTVPLQVKLLRFLQEQKVERVGGRKPIFIDVRIIAATNKDLEKAMAEGSFRQDLFYRLRVVTVTMPPLRERQGDALVLANAFLQKYAADHNKKITGFTHRANIAIMDHSWPGNVRELENRIKRAVIMAENPRITPADLEMASVLPKFENLSLKTARDMLQKDLIVEAMARHKDNISKASEELGISRPTLYDLMNKLGIAKSRS